MTTRFSTMIAASLIAVTSLSLASCGSEGGGSAGDGKLYSKVKENDTTDMDKNKEKEAKEASKLSEEEIKEESKKAVTRFFETEYNPERLEKIKSLDKPDYELLQNISKKDNYLALSDEDKEKVVRIADDVYKIQDVYAYTTNLSEEDLANLIVGLNTSLNLLFHSGIESAVTAEIDESKASISEDKRKVTFPKDSLSLVVDGEKNPSYDDATVVFENGTYKLIPDVMIETGKLISESPEGFDGKLFEKEETDDIKAKNADR